MSINKAQGMDRYIIACNLCGVFTDVSFASFMEAVAFKQDKSNGWRSTKNSLGEWQDLCPACAKKLVKAPAKK